MAVFKPFTAFRYDEAKVGSLSSVVAPPYDVINADDVAKLHQLSEYNITHLTRPAGDTPYKAASETFSTWQNLGALTADTTPQFYIYRQKFIDPDTGAEFPERVGVVGLLKVEDYSTGNVLPHENTLSAARADRLSLLRETQANFESIYGLYSDPNGIVAKVLDSSKSKGTVVANIDDAIGSSHSLELLNDLESVKIITDYLATVPVFIADGHHRYETSLGFSKERPDLAGAEYILITLTALEDEGLLVLPTHRLLRNFAPGEVEILPARLIEKGFEVNVSIIDDVNLQPLQFILVTPETEYLISLPSKTVPSELVSGNNSSAWKSLDVTVLHTLIIGDILDVKLDQLSSTDKVTYTRDASEARRKVASGEAQAAIIMARPTVAQMKAVSEAGDKMPQKSTFFYPKLLSGLVLYDLKH